MKRKIFELEINEEEGRLKIDYNVSRENKCAQMLEKKIKELFSDIQENKRTLLTVKRNKKEIEIYGCDKELVVIMKEICKKGLKDNE